MSKIEKSLATGEDMEKINTYTLRKYTADEVFTFKVRLCDNEVDRDFQCFDRETLTELAKKFIGVTGISDHKPESGNQRARIYDAVVVDEPETLTSRGEVYSYISAKCYIPRTQGNREFIESVESGIRKEVSVGCSVKNIECSICGCKKSSSLCEHIPGQIYDGEVCAEILKDAADAYEWSFVAVPAQRNAGIIKSAGKDSDGNYGTERMIEKLRREAAAAMKIHKKQRDELVAKAALLLPELDTEMFMKVCSRLSAEETNELNDAFGERLGNGIQCMSKKEKTSDNTDEYYI